MKRGSGTIVVVIVLVALFGLASVSLWQADHEIEAQASSDGDLLYLPLDSIPPGFLIGQATLVSSLLWVRVMFYYSDALLDGRQPRHLPKLIRAAVALDTAWRYPYEFGGLVLVDHRDRPSDDAIAVMESGVHRFPSDWRLRVFLAMAYMSSRSDTTKAAETLMPLASMPAEEVPAFARTLGYTLLAESGDIDRAVSTILETYEVVEDPMVQVILLEKMRRLIQPVATRHGVDPELIVQVAMPASEDEDPMVRTTSRALLVALAKDQMTDEGMRLLQSIRRQARAGADP